MACGVLTPHTITCTMGSMGTPRKRSWDGRLLPFKHGAMGLVLALGQPVIPVGISGAYELMPRWTSKIKRTPVTIRIGQPTNFDPIPIPEQTKDDIERASAKLKSCFLDLIGDKA